MPLTRKRATIWTASDGTEFTDFVKAAEHEHELDIRKRLAAIFGDSYSDTLSPIEVIDTLIKHRAELAKLFVKTRAVYKREAKFADVEVEALK